MSSQFKIAQTASWTLSVAAHLGLGWALLSQPAPEAAVGVGAPEGPGVHVILVDARVPTGSALDVGETTASIESPPPSASPDGEAVETVTTTAGKGTGDTSGAAAAAGVASASAERNVAGAADLDAFQRRLLAHIARYKNAPTGQDAPTKPVLVRFVLQKDGSVSDAWIYASSGLESFDAAALRTVERAQPLPSPPAGLPDPLNVVLPVPFVNQGG